MSKPAPYVGASRYAKTGWHTKVRCRTMRKIGPPKKMGLEREALIWVFQFFENIRETSKKTVRKCSGFLAHSVIQPRKTPVKYRPAQSIS
jgi:hypothetical protein